MFFLSLRRPSQILREAEEIDVMALLQGAEPKDYEKILREAGVYDFRAILKHLKMMQKQMEIEEEPEFLVSFSQLMCRNFLHIRSSGGWGDFRLVLKS